MYGSPLRPISLFLFSTVQAQRPLPAAPQPSDPEDAPPAEPLPSLEETASDVGAALLSPDAWLELLATLGRIGLLIGVVAMSIRLLDALSQRWTRRFEDLPASHPRRQRASTISNLLSSAARYLLWPLALIIILSEVGIDVAALVATAGIAGLAIGFGAQTLVQDVISGIFLLFDDTIHVGDFVNINGQTGTVEHIGVRLIKVRQLDGEVLMVPAGELRIFGNRSIEYARAVVTVNLPYGQDTEAILQVMQRVADAWADENEAIIIDGEKPVVQAITALEASSVAARILVAVRPGEQWPAERALRLRLKEAFEETGVEIPFPRHVVFTRSGHDQGGPLRPVGPYGADTERPTENID